MGTLLNDKFVAGTSTGDWLGGQLAEIMAMLGSSDAKEALASNAAAKKREAADAGPGYRGKGFSDPRIIDGSQERLEAANRAIDLRIHVTTDSAAFTAEVIQEMSRQSNRQ